MGIRTHARNLMKAAAGKSSRSLVRGAVFSFVLAVGLVSCTLSATAAEEEIISLVETPAACTNQLRPSFPYSKAWVRVASEVTGFAVGISNDVFLTLSRNEYHLLPPEVARWTIFFNEFANIISTSTGKKWIYSGTRKRVIDNVALGVLLGSSLRLGISDGLVTGALGFGASYGLTYWFPNKYFHGLMEGIPKKLPTRLGRVFETGFGKAFIGVSMIVAVEITLEHAIEIAQWLPRYLNLVETGRADKGRRIASLESNLISLDLSTALWLVTLDHVLQGPLNAEKGKRIEGVLTGTPITLSPAEREALITKVRAHETKAWSKISTLGDISRGLQIAP